MCSSKLSVNTWVPFFSSLTWKKKYGVFGVFITASNAVNPGFEIGPGVKPAHLYVLYGLSIFVSFVKILFGWGFPWISVMI